MEYNLIQAPEIIRRLAVKLGIRQAHIAPTLAENVVPVILLDDLTDRDQSDVRRCAGGVSGISAGAFLFNAVLFNPVASGIVAKVSRLFVGLGAADQINVGLSPAINVPASTIGGFKQRLDEVNHEAPNVTFPQCLVYANAAAAIDYTTGYVCQKSLVGPSTLNRFDLEASLYPGTALIVCIPTPIVAARINFEWQEQGQ